jgi:antitoxin CptB
LSATDTAGLRWKCRRGMKELDVLLERFLHEKYEGLSEAQQRTFRELLELEDPDLYALLMGQQAPRDEAWKDVIESIRQ